MQQRCNLKLQELKKLQEKYRKIEHFLLNHSPEKIYCLKTLRVGLAHLELDISLLQKQY
jgi:hypothetical protein